jgi:NAD-dependent dihydropyrimidine dehydrogenase PreA subunit
MFDTLKTIIETMFRFFPFPTKTGLRTIGHPGPDGTIGHPGPDGTIGHPGRDGTIGHPGPDAPVFVTCNFDLTVRRVTKALQGLDCYLLVAPSKGINVWCASGGGMFNAHSVTSVVKTSRIAEKVEHRTLILPQLSAPGIDVARVEQETGWHCKFGPVYARDIAEYVAAGFAKTEAMSRARFPLGDRLEMAVMWAAPLSIVAAIPVAIFSPQSLPGVLALIWGFALFLLAFYDPVMRYVPGPAGLVKTMVLGLVGVAGVAIYGLVIGQWSWATIIGWSLGILAVALVLGFDLDGTGPLHAGSTVAYWGRKWPWVLDIWAKFGYELEQHFVLEVDEGRCRGCATCVAVCPKGVFDLYRLEGADSKSQARQRSRVARMESCEQCTACVKQCPENAILADPPIRVFV